jgi:hypothetical protein
MPSSLAMDLGDILARSRATPGFKADVRRYLAVSAAPRIAAPPRAPAIKVVRVVAQLLALEPDLVVQSVRIDAESGCADFAGTVEVECEDLTRQFEFVWDCAWRAEQEQWTDAFGFPDQIRAAHEFGWRCFRVWRHLDRSVAVAGQ